MHKDNIFRHFPKKSPPLPSEISKIYLAYYKTNREGKTLASFLARKMDSWLHRQVASDIISDKSYKTTLEIGAGTLNQLLYEPKVGRYDIVEPLKEFYKNSNLLKRVCNIYSDISEISDCQQYDRITSIGTFEHISNLPEVIAKSGVLLKAGGVLRIGIPSEGTFLWTLGWKITTGLEFKIKYGLDYSLLMRHEHVNTAKEIEKLLRYFFRKVDRKVFGLSRAFSFYQFYLCASPDKTKCLDYIKEIEK